MTLVESAPGVRFPGACGVHISRALAGRSWPSTWPFCRDHEQGATHRTKRKTLSLAICQLLLHVWLSSLDMDLVAEKW